MKRWMWIVGVILALFAGGFLVIQNTTRISSVSHENRPSSTEAPVILTTRTDPAGFSFQYPKDSILNPHEEDMETYAHIELTHPRHPGMLILWAKDPLDVKGKMISDITTWLAGQKDLSSGSVVDTTLAGAPAKKIRLSGRMITVAILDDMLVQIETTGEDSSYWEQTAATLTQTFALTSTASNAADSQDMAESAADEEEVLE